MGALRKRKGSVYGGSLYESVTTNLNAEKRAETPITASLKGTWKKSEKPKGYLFLKKNAPRVFGQGKK